MPSTTAPLTWPTTAELDALSDCFGSEEGAVHRISELHDYLKRLVNLDVAPAIEEVHAAIERGAEPLTVEHVGSLSSCLAKLRFDIDWMRDAVRDMERMRDTMALEVVVDAQPRVPMKPMQEVLDELQGKGGTDA